VSGRAEVVHDKTKAEELWTPGVATRFPTGPDDPRLVLLRVEVEAVEYWDSP
jgi:general stress protein 26